MREIVEHIQVALTSRIPAAYCRLVETRGSTPQKAGALMLVFADGSQRGTLGGGCVEAEVKRRALAVLAEQRAEIARFQLDSDYGWDDGLICGGRMEVLIAPLDRHTEPYFRQIIELNDRGEGYTEAVAFDPHTDACPSPASFLFDQHDEYIAGMQFGTAGASQMMADCPEPVRSHLRPLQSRPRPYAAQGIGYLPSQTRCSLFIIGGGHVGQAVANLAGDLEFDVTVVDDRGEYVTAERFPKASQRIAGDIEQVLPQLDITPHSYCLIVTRGHSHDEQALFHLAERGARYVGMIGSRRKIKMIFDDLLAEGISPAALAQVYAPLGIDIGSQTVPEIAVSICAELVAHRNRNGQVPGRPAPVLVADGSLP
ncbi:MAG: XdhC family protein [Pirellulaceae bacterium]